MAALEMAKKCLFTSCKLRFLSHFRLAYTDVGKGREQDAVALLGRKISFVQRSLNVVKFFSEGLIYSYDG